MKANRKYKDSEEAVSAVIGVILMVAITVAIAATVYVYVSGMIGGGSESTPTMALNVDNAHNKFTVVSAGTDVAWSDVKVKCDTDGAMSVNAGTNTSFTADTYNETTDFGLSDDVTAGDSFQINWPASGTLEFTFLYEPTNAVMSTCKVVI